MSILNLTQHAASADQVEVGVVEPSDKKAVQALLTFNSLPSKAEIEVAAAALAEQAAQSGLTKAMIGGAPFFMSALEKALVNVGVAPLYAFSLRESVDEVQADGSIRKTAVFRHGGFVEV